MVFFADYGSVFNGGLDFNKELRRRFMKIGNDDRVAALLALHLDRQRRRAGAGDARRTCRLQLLQIDLREPGALEIPDEHPALGDRTRLTWLRLLWRARWVSRLLRFGNKSNGQNNEQTECARVTIPGSHFVISLMREVEVKGLAAARLRCLEASCCYLLRAAITGGRCRQNCVRCSNACASCSTPKSSPWRPTICRPTGRPSGENPQGIEIAGRPVTVMK